jgi:hypothetical protein
MLMNIVSTGEKSFHDLAFHADREYLASRVYKFVRIIRQQVKIETELSKLSAIEISSAGLDRNIARR